MDGFGIIGAGGVNEQDKAIELLTEIRDLLVESEKKNDKQCEESIAHYKEHSLRKQPPFHLIQWGLLFCIVFLAVALALELKN
jgi:hypothetical protein